MAEGERYVEIRFKEEKVVIWYYLAEAELQRLSDEFINSGGRGVGVYDVQSETNSRRQPRKLFLRFDDVLYIG